MPAAWWTWLISCVSAAYDGKNLMRNYAIEGAGAATWEWSSRRNEIATGSIIEEVLGLQRGELTCGLEDWLKHLRLGDRERLRSQIEAMLQKGAGQIQADFQMRSGDGTFRWFALRGATLPQSDQRSLRCVGLLREITREMRAHERLIIDAVRDNLTGLPNRELFMDRLTVNLQRARQDGIPSKAALLLVEIDRFDKILDEFGSIRADSMFLTVSKRLVRSVAPQDTLARMSNDQFAILVANGGDQREVAMFAEHVRRSIRSPMKFAGREIILTGSIGIAGVQDDQVEPEQLLRDADTALFRAKRSGVDRVEVFRPNMRTETDDRTVDVDLLRKAMERKQIFALYQPIYSLSPERLAGFECVLRWEHPQRGAMGPSEFMRIADRGGLAAQLALQVLEKAATDAAGWQKAVPRTENTLFLSINVGDKLPLQPEFVQEVRTLLGRHNLPRGSLRFEISDSALRENPERGTEVLGWLRNAGAGAILSDFGAGQLPLGDLSRLAIDGIRLDRWLCFDALGEGPGVALVRGIAALARELDRPVIADSVESTEDVAVLRAAGCTLALGPLYGDPLSERQMDELLSVVRKAELRNERRGLLGGGLLSRNKRPTATAGRSTKVSEAAAGAARAGRKKVAASTLPVGQNGFNGSAFEADDEEALPFARTNGEMVDYDEAVSAAMIASAQDAARHFEQSQSAIPPAGHISDASLRVGSPTGLPLAAPPSMAIDGGGNGQPATNGLLSPNGASPPSDATGVIASQLANAFASRVPQADPQAPLQLAAASDTPTLLLSPRAGAAKPLPSVPAREMLSGLARLQRGAFGVRTNGAAAAPSENKGSDTSDPANPPVGLADTMPDNDVLRGLAQRLEAALRRERR